MTFADRAHKIGILTWRMRFVLLVLLLLGLQPLFPQEVLVRNTVEAWKLRATRSTDASSVIGVLVPNEFYRVRETLHENKETWIELEVPIRGTAWVKTAKTDYELKPEAEFQKLNSGLSLKATYGDDSDLVADVEASVDKVVFPIWVYSPSNDPAKPPDKLGQLDGPGRTSLPLPAGATKDKTFVVILVSAKALSNRVEVRWEKAKPLVTVDRVPPVRISTLAEGDVPIQAKVHCESEVQLSIHSIPPVLALEGPTTFPCKGDRTIFLRFNASEWRITRGRARPLILEFSYAIGRKTGLAEGQLVVQERWSLWDWLLRIGLPWSLLLALATVAASYAPLLFRWRLKRIPPHNSSPSPATADPPIAPQIQPDADFKKRLKEVESLTSETAGGLKEVNSKLAELSDVKAEVIPKLGKILDKIEGLVGLDFVKKWFSATDIKIDAAAAASNQATEHFESGLASVSESLSNLQTKVNLWHENDAERTRLHTSVVGKTEQLTELVNERNDLKEHLIFVGDDSSVTLDRLYSSLNGFISATQDLQDEFLKIVEGPLGDLLAVRSISEGYVGSFSLGRPRLYLGELSCLKKYGRSALPELVARTRKGACLAPQELSEAMSFVVYCGCVSGSWDLVLAGAERFRHLDKIAPLTTEAQLEYSQAVVVTQQHLDRANNFLRDLNVTPVHLPFLSPITSQISPVAQRVAGRFSVDSYYPEWRVDRNEARERILDCRRWAYLDERGKLYDQRAQIVVSA